jgi:hypothetical protein
MKKFLPRRLRLSVALQFVGAFTIRPKSNCTCQIHNNVTRIVETIDNGRQSGGYQHGRVFLRSVRRAPPRLCFKPALTLMVNVHGAYSVIDTSRRATYVACLARRSYWDWQQPSGPHGRSFRLGVRRPLHALAPLAEWPAPVSGRARAHTPKWRYTWQFLSYPFQPRDVRVWMLGT